MKTAIEVVKEIVLSHPVSMDNVQVEDFEGEEWSEILLPVMTDAMKAYAQQACEELRERIVKNAKVKYCRSNTVDQHGEIEIWEEVDKQSIRNTEIILP